MNNDEMAEELAGFNMAHTRIHSRADELISCLEGEIAKRDEELAACRVAVENCEVFRARIAELEDDLKCAHSMLCEVSKSGMVLRAELAAIKAQDTVGEVVGWYRLDRPYEMTSYPSVCATWHKLGAPVAPLYAAPAPTAADAPPENCRQRLAAEGKPYPRSSCAVCGKFSPKWRECDAALAAHRTQGVV